MWQSVLFDTERFVNLTQTVNLDVREWRIQREIYLAASQADRLRLGFATFYLNRVNRSGIIKNAGPIGGLRQTGEWKIDARFNRDELCARVTRASSYGRHISVTQHDALDFLQHLGCAKTFVYLDPPYYEKGRELYLNHYGAEDHARLAEFMRKPRTFKWAISYDDTPAIRKLYEGFRKTTFQLGYSVSSRKCGRELLISNRDLLLPNGWRRTLPPLREIAA